MSSRKHFHRSERYEAGESCSCNWGWIVPVASAVIGAAGSYLGSREQAKAMEAAQQDPWGQYHMYPDAEPHAGNILSEAQRLYATGSLYPQPHMYDLEGRKNIVEYARSVMPELVEQAQTSWQTGLDPELNPYVDAMIEASQRGLTEDYERSILPRISSASQAVGGFGGSRQGVAEGIASEGYAEALADIDTQLRHAAYVQAMEQQRAAWGAAPTMIGLGTMPGQTLSSIGKQYQDDDLSVLRNLQAYASLVQPYSQPSLSAGGPYMTPMGDNPYTSILQGAAGGLGLYNMFSQPMADYGWGWGGTGALGSGSSGSGGLLGAHQTGSF